MHGYWKTYLPAIIHPNTNFAIHYFVENIGSKAPRDKENQIAHVRKSRGSLGTKNMAANRERASALMGRKSG